MNDIVPPTPRRRVTAGGAVRYFDREDPCCLYRLLDADDVVIYVGISHDPATRLRSHYTRQAWAHEIARSELTWHTNKGAAERAERAAVAQLKPRHNVVHTDEHRVRSVAHMPLYVRERMARRIEEEGIARGHSRSPRKAPAPPAEEES